MAAQSSRYEDGKFLVEITNSMFSQLHVEQRVRHWTDINAHVFVTLFEGISGEPLRDVIRQPRTKEDEVHNVQVVIDTLSLDLLHISLSHITGEDVVSGSKRAIGNLMEVILGLLEFILEGIGSDLSSEDTLSQDVIDDPDMLTGELIDEILHQELSKKCHIADNSHGASSLQSTQSPKRTGITSATNGEPTIVGHGTTRTAWEPSRLGQSDATGNSTADLIALGRSSLDDPSHLSANNTANLVALGDSRYGHSSPPQRDLRKPANGASVFDTAKQSALLNLGSQKVDSRISSSQGPSNVATVSPTKNVTSPLDSSLASSVARPEFPSLSGGPPTSEFDALGLRPRTAPHQAYFGAGHVGNGLAGGSGSVLSNLSGPGSTSFTHHLYHHFDRAADRAGVNLPDFSSSLPLDPNRPQGYTSSRDPSTRADGVSTLPPRSKPLDSKSREERRNTSGPSGPTQRSASLGLKSHSYDNLQSLMQDTVAMSRAAIQTSPLRHPGSAGSSRSGSSDNQDPVNQVLKRINEQSSRILALSGKDGKTTQPATTNGKTTQPSTSGKGAKVSYHRPASGTSAAKSATSPKGIFSPTRRAERADKSGKKVSFHVTHPAGEKSSFQTRPRQTNTSPRDAASFHSSTFPAPAHRSTAARSLFAPPPNADYKPKTFMEYLDKYYGIVNHRDRLPSTEGEETPTSRQSDSAFDFSDASPGRAEDYSGDADSGEEVEARRSKRAQRSVHFDDKVQHKSTRVDRARTSRTGRVGPVQRQLNDESKVANVKAKALAKLYDMELEDFEEEVKDHMKSTRQKGRTTDREYKKKVLRQPKTNKYKPARKTSVLRPRVRTRSSSATGRSHKSPAVRGRKRSASASPAIGRRAQRRTVRPCDDDLLPWLLEEFPFLHLSTETLHELWQKSSRQIEQLTKAHQEVRRKKTKAQVQIEEAERRQTILMDIMKKELAHNQRMKDLKDRLNHQQSVRTQLRNRRQQSARSRRYYDEFQVQARSKMLKKRTREELVFKHLFKDGLEIQRDRIRELRRYAKEDRERRAQRHQNDLESIENYYRDQFAMMTEAIGRERKDIEVKDKAQSKVVSQMKKELRQKMERDIRALQEQLYRDEDEEYFRQLDADRLREELHVSQYQLRA